MLFPVQVIVRWEERIPLVVIMPPPFATTMVLFTLLVPTTEDKVRKEHFM